MRTSALLFSAVLLTGCGSIDTDPSDFPATVVTLPARTVVTMRFEELNEKAVDRFADEVEKQGLTGLGDPMVRGADLMVPVAKGTRVEAPLAVRDLKATRAAAVECRTASREVLERQVDHLYDWIAENGYRPVEPPIRVLLAWPPAPWRVEILIPVDSAR